MAEVETSVWDLTVRFNQGHGNCVMTWKLGKQELAGTQYMIRDVLGAEYRVRLRQLGWPGVGLWAEHEPVKDATNLDDLAYLRGADGTLMLEAEDHNCRWRTIRVTPKVSDECVVCFEKLTRPVGTHCMHMCCCSKCFDKVAACPVCRKRKVQV
jgi:hypothetical protein